MTWTEKAEIFAVLAVDNSGEESRKGKGVSTKKPAEIPVDEFVRAYNEILQGFGSGFISGNTTHLHNPWGFTPYEFREDLDLLRHIFSESIPNPTEEKTFTLIIAKLIGGAMEAAQDVLSNNEYGKKYLSGELCLEDMVKTCAYDSPDMSGLKDIIQAYRDKRGKNIDAEIIKKNWPDLRKYIEPVEKEYGRDMVSAIILNESVKCLNNLIRENIAFAIPAFFTYQMLHAQFYLQIYSLFDEAVFEKMKRKAQARLAGKKPKDHTEIVRSIVDEIIDDYSDLSAQQVWNRILHKAHHYVDDNCGNPRLIIEDETGKGVSVSFSSFRRHFSKIKKTL